LHATADAPVHIRDDVIANALSQGLEDAGRVRAILAKARELRGLNDEDVAVLCNTTDDTLCSEMLAAARHVKDTIYGRRLVLFAPLYISNLCGNDCAYCAFRGGNAQVKRRRLTRGEIEGETRTLVSQGHKRVLLVAGESGTRDDQEYVRDAIRTVYAVREGRGEIRRVNVNVAPMDVDSFRELRRCGIGTYQAFQETYHASTYRRVHASGPKRDYAWRIAAMDRAMTAGIGDVGIGVLFGLYDWRYEVLAMLQHVRHLEGQFGVGPHTISVPRLQPAAGSPLAKDPPHAVSNTDFLKLIAILRLAVPYTGIIMSTRETPLLRRATFELGVSQISAGSRTNPGSYVEEYADAGQFSLGDHRPLDEVIRDVASHGYIPSFCTACYRLGRTGHDFMDLAKPGEIKNYCAPNGLSTFTEYLEDYASPETREVGLRAVAEAIAAMAPHDRETATGMVRSVTCGKRDVYC
jgi:2-iminoacetate synthase